MNSSNKNIVKELLEYIVILEKELKKMKSKKSGKAKKDYDGDGEVESSEDEYLGSKDKAIKKAMGKKEIVKKDKKKMMNEGRVVGTEAIQYGGFPRILKEEKKDGIPSYALNDLIMSNNPEEDEEYGHLYTALPADVHKTVVGKIGDELEKFSKEFDVSKFSKGQLDNHLKDATDAVNILKNSGHEKHPALMHIDSIRQNIRDAIGSSDYSETIRSMRNR